MKEMLLFSLQFGGFKGMVPTLAHSGVGVMAETNNGNGGNVLSGQVDTFKPRVKDRDNEWPDSLLW